MINHKSAHDPQNLFVQYATSVLSIFSAIDLTPSMFLQYWGLSRAENQLYVGDLNWLVMHHKKSKWRRATWWYPTNPF
jgi:hypothetical protein